MFRSLHTGGSKASLFLKRRGAFSGTAVVILSLYATIAIGSVCIHAEFNSAENRTGASITPNDDDPEQICQSIHEHVLTATVVPSEASTIRAFLSLVGALVLNSALEAPKRPLNECRPPGTGFFAPSNILQLRSILRI
jgi:hypothetical protein